MPRRGWVMDLEDMSDEQLRRVKFATIRRLCDRHHLPYPPELVAYLEQRDG